LPWFRYLAPFFELFEQGGLTGESPAGVFGQVVRKQAASPRANPPWRKAWNASIPHRAKTYLAYTVQSLERGEESNNATI
jgi:hypothetical protein